MLQTPQSTSRVVMLKVFLTGTTTAATGKTVAITISKAGAAFGNPNVGTTNATELSSGWYKVTLDTTDTGTLGDLVVRGTASGCDDTERVFGVVKATTGGLTALPDAAAEAAGGLFTRGTGAGQINQDANGRVDTNTKTWNALTTVALPLVPTVAGRTLDVSAGGEAGIDWANVGGQSTAVNLSATTTNLVNTLTTYTNNTPQTGDNFARIGATGSGLTSLAPSATALSITQWSNVRAGYLDNLNVGGLVASSAEATAIQNNTRVVRVVPDVIERPDAGTTTYRIELLLYDAVGNMEAPDSAPTIALVNQAGTDKSARLDSTTMALVSTGRYRAIYTADVADALEQLVWTFSVVEGGVTRLYGNTSLIVDTSAVDFTAADRTKLNTLAADYTTTRAGYIDNLSGGAVALASGVRLADAVTHGGSTAKLRLGSASGSALQITCSDNAADAVLFDHSGGTATGAAAFKCNSATGIGLYANGGAVDISGDIQGTITQVNNLAASAIGPTAIADNAITSSKLAPNCITSNQLADNAITAAKIANAAIDTATFAAGTTIPRCTLVDTVTALLAAVTLDDGLHGGPSARLLLGGGDSVNRSFEMTHGMLVRGTDSGKAAIELDAGPNSYSIYAHSASVGGIGGGIYVASDNTQAVELKPTGGGVGLKIWGTTSLYLVGSLLGPNTAADLKTALDLDDMLKLLEADEVIRTDTTPWTLEYRERGAATVLLTKQLKQLNGTDLIAAGVVGQKVQ